MVLLVFRDPLQQTLKMLDGLNSTDLKVLKTHSVHDYIIRRAPAGVREGHGVCVCV